MGVSYGCMPQAAISQLCGIYYKYERRLNRRGLNRLLVDPLLSKLCMGLDLEIWLQREF